MRLNVGRIGRAHGILGEATIEVRTDSPEERFALGSVLQTDKDENLTITSARVHNGVLLLGFNVAQDRNGIEKYRNSLLYADVDIEAPGIDGDDYHVISLIGCIAYLENSEKFGEVSDVLNLPGQDLLSIKTVSGEVLIPFVRQLVPEVDIKNKRITVIPPTMAGELS